MRSFIQVAVITACLFLFPFGNIYANASVPPSSQSSNASQNMDEDEFFDDEFDDEPFSDSDFDDADFDERKDNSEEGDDQGDNDSDIPAPKKNVKKWKFAN